ncbi:MAG: tetratricopeptide repeat protein [Thermoanaerobaculia bacterium]
MREKRSAGFASAAFSPGSLAAVLLVAGVLWGPAAQAQAGSSSAVEVLAVPLPGGEKAAVPVLVEVDGPTLLEGVVSSTLDVELYVYAKNEAGAVADYLSKGLHLDLAGGAEDLRSAGLRYHGQLGLAAGNYQLTALVKVPSTGVSVSRKFPLEVPDFRSSELRLGPPVVADASGRPWVEIRQAVGGGEVALPELLAGAAEGFVAAASSVAARNRALDLAIPVSPPPQGKLSVTGQLLDEAGRVALGRQLALAGTRPGSGDRGGEMIWLLGSLELGELPPGVYQISVTVVEGGGRAHRSPATRIRLGSEVLSSEAGLALAQAETPEVSGKRAERRKALALGYRGILATLGRGDEDEAAAALARAERAEAEASKDLLLADLAEAEQGVARQLAKQDPEVLLPMALLHQVTYRNYRDGDERLLARHSRDRVRALAELYVEAGGGSKQVAASVFTSLGASLQESGLTTSANSLFERALELVPDHEGALLALAVYYEKVGRYDRAITYLERLSRDKPGNAQGWLRLGINLARQGKSREARGWLEKATAKEVEPWIRSLAYQELAGEALEAGELETARNLLEKGLEELPGEQRLCLELAMVLDRSGQSKKAREVLNNLVPLADAEAGSARLTYNHWPAEILRDERVLLLATATTRRPQLARAIDALREGELAK